jgi:hypothetical protein
MTREQAAKVQHGLRSSLAHANECASKAAARVQQSTLMLKGLVLKKLRKGKAPVPPLDPTLAD